MKSLQVLILRKLLIHLQNKMLEINIYKNYEDIVIATYKYNLVYY